MLAIIPARGGSKGLPGKNIKELCGKPLLACTAEAALASPYITRVVISTDDKIIAEVAKRYGIECPFLRPDFLSTDDAKSVDVFNFTINKLEEEGEKIDNIIILQPTSPLRTEQHINEAVELFINNKADSVISYCKEYHPIFWHKYLIRY